MRRYRATPTAWDIEHQRLLCEMERNQLEADRLDAIREHADYQADVARAAGRPRVPAAVGYDAAARRLGCDDQYEDDLRTRYGDDF
jgi:hypothetical protein